VEINGRAGEATDDNIIRRMRTVCWITNYKHTLTVCNIYCFSRAKMVSRRSLNVMFIRILNVLLFPNMYGSYSNL
jgi:hypothetical protein